MTLYEAELCRNVSKMSLIAGSINCLPMIWAFPDLAIHFGILYEASKQSSHWVEEVVSKPETDSAFKILSLIFVKNNKFLFCLSG